ncbi:MAG: RNA polymerase sigma factor [Planctomycetota bacterium]|jgi:RNA polymerase sigma-70 factor (ECF subfamily)
MQYTTHATLLGRLARRADQEAWREFHERYGELIRCFARRYGLQPADCDDVVQDVLVALTASMESFRYDPAKGRFRSYLKTLTVRAVFQRLRRGRPEVSVAEPDVLPAGTASDDNVEKQWEREWRHNHVRRAMRRVEAEFNEKDKIAFTHYAVNGMSARDTAAALGVSNDRVYQVKSRILKRLSGIIQEQIQDEG